MEIYQRSNERHSRAGRNPVPLDSRLRGNDGKFFSAARLTVIMRRINRTTLSSHVNVEFSFSRKSIAFFYLVNPDFAYHDAGDIGESVAAAWRRNGVRSL